MGRGTDVHTAEELNEEDAQLKGELDMLVERITVRENDDGGKWRHANSCSRSQIHHFTSRRWTQSRSPSRPRHHL